MSGNIIVAEDDDVTQRLIVHFLEHGGHSVKTAVDGKRALQLILQECPDVLVADYALLGLDGLELCRRVRHLYNRGVLPHYTSIILLANELQNFAESLEAGADDLIIKKAESLSELQSEIQSCVAAAIRLRTSELNYATVAQYDTLTHLLNRHTFLAHSKEIWKRSLSSHYPLSVAMFDCDNFKRINHSFGVRCGDAVLEKSAEIIREVSRTNDILCRFSGDEFCALLSGCNEEKAIEWAERVRLRFDEQPLSVTLDVNTKVDVKITFSFGIAGRSDQTSKLEQLIMRADTAMDIAKKSGRNRCAVYAESSETPDSQAASPQTTASGVFDGLTVNDVMSDVVIPLTLSVSLGMATNDLCEMMVQRSLQSVPVIDDNGHFAGTITIQSLLQSLANKTNPFDNLIKSQESGYPIETPLSTIYESLIRNNKTHYWITSNNVPVGMVTVEKLLRWMRKQ